MDIDLIFSNLNAIFLVACLAILTAAVVRFARLPNAGNISFLTLVAITAGFYVFYATFVTWGQYYTWASSGEYARTFISSSLPAEAPFPGAIEWIRPYFDRPTGYFMYYSFGHFWLRPLIAIATAGIFYFFLIFLRRWKSKFFKKEEIELGFLCALLSGWPGITVFIPLVLISMIGTSIVRIAIFKLRVTTIGWSFITSAVLTILFGGEIVSILGLNVLKV